MPRLYIPRLIFRMFAHLCCEKRRCYEALCALDESICSKKNVGEHLFSVPSFSKFTTASAMSVWVLISFPETTTINHVCVLIIKRQCLGLISVSNQTRLLRYNTMGQLLSKGRYNTMGQLFSKGRYNTMWQLLSKGRYLFEVVETNVNFKTFTG